MKYKIWDGVEELITPIGEVLTAEQVTARYPMAKKAGMQFIICDSAIQLGVFMEYTTTKEFYAKMGVTFTEGMKEQEVLNAITAFEETPVVELPTAEERMAAALEYANLLKIEEKQAAEVKP